MALSFPREPFMEMLFPGLGWVDLTSQVRQTSPVTITRGRANEQGQVAPSMLTALMNNGNGNMSPSNPMGDYFGLLGRNTPVRWGLTVARDACAATVSNGWGSSDTGDTWTISTGSVGDFAKAGGKATQSHPSAGLTRSIYLSNLPLGDAETRVTVTLPFTNVTGGSIFAELFFRRQASPVDYYTAGIEILTDESVRLNLGDTGGGSYGSLFTDIIHSSSQALTIAGMVDGFTLYCKVWREGVDPEPDWMLVGTDAVQRITAPGPVGFRTLVDSSNSNTAPIVISADNIRVRQIRFVGELADLRPAWNENHTDKRASLQAAGMLRRLGRSKKPLKTALERYIVQNATQPIAYWPMDDDELVRESAARIGAVHAAVIVDFYDPAPTVESGVHLPFGTGKLFPWLRPGGQLRNNLFLDCPLDNSGDMIPAGSSYTAHCVAGREARYSSNTNADALVFGTSGLPNWSIVLNPADNSLNVLGPSGASAGSAVLTDFYNGVSRHLGFRAVQNGANIDWALIVDGAIVASGTVAATTNPSVGRVIFQKAAGTETNYGRSIGHMVIYGGNGPALDEFYDAVLGRPGETAGRRTERLCAEEGLPFSYVGDLDDTIAMGPQQPARLVDSLQECADAEQGTLYESRSVLGLALRTRHATETQAATLTLDYAAGHVAPLLQPTHDDQGTVNDFTAKRQDGGEYRFEKISGSLNINDPDVDPDGAGRNDDEGTFNVATDDQLPSIAQRVVARGTVKEDRFPTVRVNLAVRAIDGDMDMECAVLNMDVDDRMVVDHLTDADVFDPLDQIARGYTEALRDAKSHEITFNTAPYRPYRIFTLGTSRATGNASTLNAGLDDNDLSWQVATTSGHALWTTDAADFPMDIMIGGERVTLSSITGSSSPQTFNASQRSVNSVVKSHLAGALVTVAGTDYLG